MQREIKFRAWVIAHKEMWEDVNPRHFRDFPESYVLMQFTGLTDKNGVEIYEDDIVIDQHQYSDSNKGVVRYRATLGRAIGWTVNGFYMSSMSKWIKVIGNIHENPELLES